MDPYDLLNDSVLRFDGTGRILGWNVASETLYGHARDAAVGEYVRSLLMEEGSEWAERVGMGDGWRGEAIRTTAAGPALIQLHWTIRRDDGGEVTEIIEVGRQAQELRDLRTSTRENAFRYENLFQSLAVGFFQTDFRRVGGELLRLRDEGVTDLRGHLLADPSLVRRLMNLENVVDVNRAAVTLFAADEAADLRGPRSSRYWPDESIPDYVDALMAVIEKKPQFVCETRLQALDGRLLDVLFTVAWSPESAKRGVMIVGVIDLGDRNRAFAELAASEAKFRNMFDAMSIGLLEYDFAAADVLLARYRAEGVKDLAAHLLADERRMLGMLDAVRIVAMNERALEAFGVGREERLPSSLRWLWPPDAYPIVAEAIAGRYRKQTMKPVETRLRRMDGQEIDVSFTIWAEPERRSDRPVLCAIVDIGERVRSQQRMERLQAEFAHASRIAMLGELAASVAHEVSQPLSAVVTNADTLIRSLARESPNMDALDRISRHTLSAARRAADIIGRVRSLALPAPPTREPLSINDVVEQALRFVAFEMKQARVRLASDLAGDLPLVSGDRVQLQQVVVNLALNAAQAMQGVPLEDRELVVSTSHCAGQVTLSVQDRGPGFAADLADRLFDSFYTTKPSGMGIGLAVCRSITEAHGGTIEASPLSCGARFSVTLPVLAPASRGADG